MSRTLLIICELLLGAVATLNTGCATEVGGYDVSGTLIDADSGDPLTGTVVRTTSLVHSFGINDAPLCPTFLEKTVQDSTNSEGTFSFFYTTTTLGIPIAIFSFASVPPDWPDPPDVIALELEREGQSTVVVITIDPQSVVTDGPSWDEPPRGQIDLGSIMVDFDAPPAEIPPLEPGGDYCEPFCSDDAGCD